ncbi:Transposon TX1 uncharacterized 149 kDa protein [Vitis vinifera]|uniref:Transposon TX1 uncharacterized 149 kDa protein n=1 Tax=Vitis vinifera TaxID=29760 RepID=A0A438DF22_VITVI|nr:Transposon TX1 uncharacterized 149 kDa protein [Vitis vinifera]
MPRQQSDGDPGGDFNVILSQRERSRQGRLSGAMRSFAQTVDDLDLIDLPMQGGIATWNGGRNNQSWARLDRFLVTQQWLDMFSGVAQCRMHRPTSDHFPILLMGGGIRRDPTPFRFENMWLKVDGFIDLLRGWWQGIEVRGRASFRLAYKMKVLKHKIKVWNREVFGRLEVNKNSALQHLEYWDGKSRELWLKEGDRNTGYFHRMANAHRRNNSMDRIMINGELLTEDQEVRDGIVNEFQKLLSEEQGWRADIEGLQFNQLSSRDADDLEVPFSVEEIHSALMEMGGDKAPGPDGFSVAFWQECWDFVKEEVVEMFKEFFVHGSFAKSLNTTFLVLIPKKGGAEDLRDFRPISLLGGLYKLLAKVLANRLKKVLDRVVSVDQNAFVRGRQILDASLVANEVIDYCWVLFEFKGVEARRPPLSLPLCLGYGSAQHSIRRAVDELEELAAELGCRLGALPTVYLGLPLGALHKTSSSWDGVEERMRRRLAQWKRQYISKGGRITLIKSTLASIPIYLLSLFAFLRLPKEEGGLGIRKIDLLNKALLGKWVWRYAYEKDNLWKTVIGVKYGQEGGGWKTKEVCGPFGVGLWKEIMKEVDWCWENIVFKVGKGNRVLFWTDKWCGNEALAQSYPQLFTLAGHKNAKVCEVWDSSMGQGGWNLRLTRDFNDWEMEQIGDMLNLLKDFRTSLEEDSVRWKREGNGVFGAKGAYNILSGSSAGVFPYRRIWMDKVPTKVSFLLGKPRGGRSLLWISFREGGGSSQTSASYAAMKRKVRITSSYIVQ